MKRDVPELITLANPAPCRLCKQPALTATPRSTKNGLHPWCCPDVIEPVPAQRWRLAMATMLATMPVVEYWIEVRARTIEQSDWHSVSSIPCICGSRDDVTIYRPQGVYRCPDHSPLQVPIQSWEVRQ